MTNAKGVRPMIVDLAGGREFTNGPRTHRVTHGKKYRKPGLPMDWNQDNCGAIRRFFVEHDWV